MILNVVDRRKRQYRWKFIDVIVEPTWHDNACDDSDQASRDEREPGYAARKNIPLAEAISWAAALQASLTVYLYDQGSDTVPDWPPSHYEMWL